MVRPDLKTETPLDTGVELIKVESEISEKVIFARATQILCTYHLRKMGNRIRLTMRYLSGETDVGAGRRKHGGVAMVNTLRFLLVMLVVFCLWTSGCSSSAIQPHLNTTNQETSKEDSFSKVDDWAIRLVRSLSSDETQRRVRCNTEQLCWVWDEHSVWIAEGTDTWRAFYSIPSGQGGKTRIRSVFVESSLIGWIIQDSALYKTEDGGRSLRRVVVPGLEGNLEGSVTDLFFLDKKHGWIVGGRFGPLKKNDPLINTEITRNQIRTAYILHTSNCGATWEFVDLPRLVGSFEEINFWSKRIGLASSRTSLVFTNDAGDTWISMDKYIPKIDSERGKFESGFFLDENHGWLLFSGFDFQALLTDNGGKSWTKATWKIESTSDDTSSYPPSPRFAFIDSTHAVFVYNHTNGGELFETSDAGKTWRLVTIAGVNDSRFTDVLYESKERALLVGNKGIYSLGLGR
jgi:photosystem II stability/assembly factor-like uncharacterized protein